MGKIKKSVARIFDKNAEEGFVPNREAVYFALGLGGQNISYNLVSGWFFYFCNAVLKISPFHVGILTSLTRLWDGVNDPIVGAIVDHRKTKPGQKLHPYLGKFACIYRHFHASALHRLRRFGKMGYRDSCLRLFHLGYALLFSGCRALGYLGAYFAPLC